MSSPVEVARSPLPDGVERYPGRWIAIRGGEIVADADTFEALIDDERVDQKDVLYRVPERGSSFYDTLSSH
jgi:Family of unknown function (DUF5678)